MLHPALFIGVDMNRGFQIVRFADDLRGEIVRGELKKVTLANLCAALEILETAGKLAVKIERLYFGDISEADFNTAADRILAEE